MFGVKNLFGKVQVCRMVKSKGDIVSFRDAKGAMYALPADLKVVQFIEGKRKGKQSLIKTSLRSLYEKYSDKPGECFIFDLYQQPTLIVFHNFYEGAEYVWPEGIPNFIEGNLAVHTPSKEMS